ncbi:tetratricopeptide repeat protein [Chryseobacterium populi]|uniref:Response regulator containing CheY-like receiver domain and AraC-type DNA-binding domain n=1 Tax=Chryseobacterium populi TaxID=1144316 RepID=J2TBY9_9FLAO|nr:tetratricopeptide repeat protein [Chryseobacterium populi]EJL75667.1 response regulator containing CheY-like receiver domain and AraC-type DNA-binding domain [Chryseobacterium populi]
MKKKIFLFFFGIITVYAYSQSFDFENSYKYARSLANKNPDSSEIVLNQIIEHAQRDNQPNFLAKAYYLKAFNSYLKSDAKKTLEFSEKALAVSQQNNYPVGKALAYRMQGTQYAKLGLLKESEQSLNQAISEVKNDNTDEGHELKGQIYNSFLILLNQKEYRKKEYYSKNAIQEFQKIRNVPRRNELLVSAYTNMGYNLAETKKFSESKSYFRKALALVGNENYYLKCSILHDIGFSFSEQNKPDSAISYYRKALKLADQYGFNEKRIEITENLEAAYAKLNDESNVQKYKLEHLKLKDSIAYNQKMAVNETLSNKEKSFDKELNKSRTLSIGLILMCLILVLILGVFVFKIIQLRKKHRDIVAKIYQQGITPVSYEEDPQEITDEEALSVTDENPESTDLLKISPAVEENILNGLKYFEENLHFNNKNVSRYNLANELNFNTKYLSSVIKKHKNFNFNQYINHLRINYIVDKLKNEPKFRKYKINHLAEITGYSSHSAFSLEFKKIVGIHPSAFIKTLDKI